MLGTIWQARGPLRTELLFWLQAKACSGQWSPVFFSWQHLPNIAKKSCVAVPESKYGTDSPETA
jgi:hypothetical protein